MDSQSSPEDSLVLDSRPNAVETLLTHETLEILAQSIASFPAKERAIILLHKVNGRTQKETAVELNLPVRTVENIRSKASSAAKPISSGMASKSSSTDMKTPAQFPTDAITRGTLFDHARTQGLAQELTDRVVLVVKRQEKRRRTVRRSVGALLLIVGFSLWGVPYFRSTDTVITQVANRQTLALSDGSFADLNAQTQLRTDFRYGRRIVRLSTGEAFFTIVKDLENPFLVETPAGIIRVTGTRFNVRLLEGEQIEVTLLDGAVEVPQEMKECVEGVRAPIGALGASFAGRFIKLFAVMYQGFAVPSRVDP